MSGVRVIFIAGLYRSGSTILDILLGNHPDIVSVGELRNLATIGWTHDGTCACGCSIRDCPFWSEVRSRWLTKVGGESAIGELASLQDTYERIRALPRVFLARAAGSAGFERYAQLTSGLFATIADVSGSAAVVDSSKYPPRAWALAGMKGIDVRIVHLVRDGRAVLWSCLRRPNTDLHGKPVRIAENELVRLTSGEWLRVNLASMLVASVSGADATRIRYEDLVEDPGEALSRIGSVAGIDMRVVARMLAEGAPLATGHTVAGNRVRMSGSIELRPDLEWRQKLPEAERRAFWRRTEWLARRLGYEKI